MPPQATDSEIWKRRAKAEEVVPPHALNVWRAASYRGRLINTYTDPAFLDQCFAQTIAETLRSKPSPVLADFACGNGIVSKAVLQRLHAEGQVSVRAWGIDCWAEALQQAKANVPELQMKQGKLQEKCFDTHSLDAGILRFALPFVRKEEQRAVLDQIYQALKPGGVLVVMNDGVFEETDKVEAYNVLFAEGSAANGKVTAEKLRASRHFPSCEGFVKNAEKAGFTCAEAEDLTERAVGYLSPAIYAHAFHLQPQQTEKLTHLFSDWKKAGVLSFEPTTLRVPFPMYRCVLKKEKTRCCAR